jgi:hypothetical protein
MLPVQGFWLFGIELFWLGLLVLARAWRVEVSCFWAMDGLFEHPYQGD